MVHITMRSVNPSCLSVSAHTNAAGPEREHKIVNKRNSGPEMQFYQPKFYQKKHAVFWTLICEIISYNVRQKPPAGQII